MKKIIAAFILALTMIFSVVPSFAGTVTKSEAAKAKFGDITGHWALEAINQLASDSIFTGNDGKFEPNKLITRSEFVTMLHKSLHIKMAYFKETDINEYFKDVKNEDSFASALYDLVTANIIDDRDEFKPNEILSREDMVHYIIRSLEYKTGGNYAMIKIFPAPFADELDINPDYSNDFMKAKILKLVNGVGNNMFKPKNGATRAESAVVIHRLAKLLVSLNSNEQVQVLPSAELVGDSIHFKLIIANNTEKKVTINHTSGQRFDFSLLDADKNILYTWSMDKMFMMMLTNTELEPGDAVEFSDVMHKEEYMDKAVWLKAYITGESEDFTVNPDGYELNLISSLK